LQTKLFGFALVVLATSLSSTNMHAQASYTLKAAPKTAACGYHSTKAAPVFHIEPELGGLYPAKRVIL